MLPVIASPRRRSSVKRSASAVFAPQMWFLGIYQTDAGFAETRLGGCWRFAGGWH